MSEQDAQAVEQPSELPSIEASGGREGLFRSADGAVIRYAWWRHEQRQPRGTVVHFNGRTEFIEKNIETAESLIDRGFDVWTLDWRGQGLSQRALTNRQKGHIEDYRQHLEDLRLFFRDHVDLHARGPFVLLGHSMGGHIGLRLLGEERDRFAKAVFTAPMVAIHGSSAAKRGAMGAFAWFGSLPGLAKAYIPGKGDYGPRDRRFANNPLTSDETRFGRMHAYIDRNPELALGGPTLGWLHASQRSIKTLAAPAFAGGITTPTLIVSAGLDGVVSNEAQHRLIQHLPNGRIETIEDAEHEILIERDELRRRFWRLFDEFLADLDGEASSAPTLGQQL